MVMVLVDFYDKLVLRKKPAMTQYPPNHNILLDKIPQCSLLVMFSSACTPIIGEGRH